MHKGVPFSFLSFFLSFSLVFVEHTKDTRDACAWIYVGRFKCTQCDDLCASVNGLFNKSFSSRRLEFRFIDFFFLCGCNKRATHFFFLLLRWRKHQSVVGVLFFAVLPAGASPCPFQEELTKQSHIREQTNAGVYQHHRRVDYFVWHASSLDGAKDVPKSHDKRR